MGNKWELLHKSPAQRFLLRKRSSPLSRFLSVHKTSYQCIKLLRFVLQYEFASAVKVGKKWKSRYSSLLWRTVYPSGEDSRTRKKYKVGLDFVHWLDYLLVVSSLKKSSLPQTNSHHPFRESVALSEHEREQMSLSHIPQALCWERPALLSVCLSLLSMDGCYETVCCWWSQPYIEHVFLHLSWDVPHCYQSHLSPLPKAVLS